jgi:FKBP-type peptidyl-prolyl cis-trans isomerase FkpA
MIKKFLFIALVISMISCGQNASKELMTKSGYKYTHVDTKGQKVQEGDYVYITIKMQGDEGTILEDIGEGPNMPVMQMPTAEKPLPEPNPVVDMLMTGGLGDSMILYLPIDSLTKDRPNPKLEGMEYLKYITYVTKILDETGYKASIEEKRLEAEIAAEASVARLGGVGQKAEQLIKDYNAGKLDVKTTPEGLKYVILEQGEGDFGAVGRRASVHYYGALLDGTMFDSSFKKGYPYTFPVGQRRVIQGWDLGIPLLQKGGSAALFIPSDLAYGETGSPPIIPGNSELMFYVELVDVI